MQMFTAVEKKKLAKILLKAADPDSSFNPVELHGFFFGLAITPDPVMPSQWIPAVFGKDAPMFDDEKDAQNCVGHLMGIYNRFMAASNDKTLHFPFDYKKISRDWFPDLEDWAYGLFKALTIRPHHWGLAGNSPEDDLSEDMIDVMNACAVVTGVALPEERNSIFETRPGTKPKSEEEKEIVLFGLLPVSVEALQSHGEMLRSRMFPRTPAPDFSTKRHEPKVGRNEPCPCGSGRKYKKCCGAN